MFNSRTTRDVAQDIKRLEEAEIPEKGKTFLWTLRDAVIDALRLSESADKVSRRNTWLLILLVVLNIRSGDTGLLELLLKLIAK